jgi:hypothetical protein
MLKKTTPWSRVLLEEIIMSVTQEILYALWSITMLVNK